MATTIARTYPDTITFEVPDATMGADPEGVRSMIDGRRLLIVDARYDFGRQAVAYTAWTGGRVDQPRVRHHEIRHRTVRESNGWTRVELDLVPSPDTPDPRLAEASKLNADLSSKLIGAENDRDIAEAELAVARHELARFKAGPVRRLLAWLRGHSRADR